MDPKSNDRYPYRDRRGEGHAKTDAEIQVMQLKAKDHLSHQNLEEARKDSSLGPSEGERPYHQLGFGLSASRAGREYISVLLSHPVCGNSLWQFQETNTEGCWERPMDCEPSQTQLGSHCSFS